MSKKENFYITSPIFYPNGKPHLGHAYTTIVCDVLYRHNKYLGKESYFLTGLDENSGKISKSAEEANLDVYKYLEGISLNFKNLYKRLNIDYSDFIETIDKEKHWPGAIKMWNELVNSGDIYKSKYIGLYCMGCETFYKDKDLLNDKCPIHLTVPEKIEEENYFFRLSKYGDNIKSKILSNELNILPESRKNEIMSLLDKGLEDVSFSRPIKTVKHGIPVPGDENQVIYVWCDALVNYISAIGYGREDMSLFDKFWPADTHVIGKDILRFHAAIWPAMLMSANLPLPKNILVHGLILSGGHKMSKSIGNIIDPEELLNIFGDATDFPGDALRFILMHEVPTFSDGDLTIETIKNSYNAHLANGIGNLTNRIMKMAINNVVKSDSFENKPDFIIDDFDTNSAIKKVVREMKELDEYIATNEPFKVVKVDEKKGKEMIRYSLDSLLSISYKLEIFTPLVSQKIIECIKENKMPEKAIFARI